MVIWGICCPNYWRFMGHGHLTLSIAPPYYTYTQTSLRRQERGQGQPESYVAPKIFDPLKFKSEFISKRYKLKLWVYYYVIIHQEAAHNRLTPVHWQLHGWNASLNFAVEAREIDFFVAVTNVKYLSHDAHVHRLHCHLNLFLTHSFLWSCKRNM